jgi:two-component system NtrC family sensor kinase
MLSGREARLASAGLPALRPGVRSGREASKPMRLTRRLTLALACAILAVLGADGFLRVQRKAALFESEIRRDAELLSRTIAGAAARIWSTAGEAQARDLVEYANQRQEDVSIRWVWLDAPQGSPRGPEVPRQAIGPLARDRSRSLRWRPPGASAESLYAYQPIAIPLANRAIEVRESLEPERAYVRETIRGGVVTTLILVALCAAVAMVIGSLFVGGPVRRLVDQARRIGQGDLSARPRVSQRDEIGQLAAEMNTMCERLEETRERLDVETAARISALEQLRHADRLTTVGKLAAGLAHEVGTPLNVITGHAQLIADEYANGSPARENAQVISQQADRVTAIIRQLLDFARQRSPRPTHQDLAALVRDTTSLLAALAHKRGVTFELDLPRDEVWARIDAGQMKQAVTNLVVNGIQSMPEGGRLTLRVERRRVHPPADHDGGVGDYHCLEVCDQGVGIEPAHLSRVFEPFFTTKDVGEGTGLGLSVSHGIVREHGGWIGVESAPGAGSRFAIFLPLGVRA